MKRFPNPLFRLLSAAAGVLLFAAPSGRAAVDTVTTTADSGPGSLRNSIAASGSGDTIVFSPALAGDTVYLTSGELLIGQNLTIDASALVKGIMISGSGNFRVLEIGSGASVILDGLTVTNGYATDELGGDGALLDDATSSLTASACAFCGNTSESGGAICANGPLMLNDCIVSGNSATVFGGGIFADGGLVTLNHCTIARNSVSSGGGGGIENEFGALILNNCVFSNNVASIFGGGIDSENGSSLAATNCTLTGNLSGTAGALSTQSPSILDNCAFSNNISTNSAGGGIANYDTLTLNHCAFSGNIVSNKGQGGALLNSGILTMNNCTLSGNSAANGNGAGIYVEPVTTNTIINCTICSNSAAGGIGGGIYINAPGIVALTNTIVAGNAAATGTDVSGSYLGAANFIGGNPELAALGNYGGPTLTMPPLFGSAVIDAGTDWVTNFLATDQRGFPRRAGAHVDIGAVEAQFAAPKNRPVLSPSWVPVGGNGSFRFTFTNAANADFTVFASTNLASPLAEWSVLGNATQYFPEQFQFTDTPATIHARFYEVISP
ncbi:MAG TPA: choice-of-anchor Q domain-containing protein [Verrucomicrobiae bacterium]|nr:choice-of-anchor Q domain-containing protein [Verrucomicrobiae bacterium]